MQQSSSQQQDPLHPQQVQQVVLTNTCLSNTQSYKDFCSSATYIILLSSKTYLSWRYTHFIMVYFGYFLQVSNLVVCYSNRIAAKGKGLHLLELLTVLAQETHLVLRQTLSHQLHLLILLVMELLFLVICRMLVVCQKV